jgi:hypothetical protein
MAGRDGGSLLQTVCFQTCDAVRRDDARATFSFDMHGDRPHGKPQKVMLGSLEFPMVQYSVEEAWSRLYFCEDVRITTGSRALVLSEGALTGRVRAEASLLLPVHLNPIERVHAHEGRAVVRCRYAHALWHGGPSRSTLALYDAFGGGAWLLHSAQGAIRVLASQVVYVSETEFSLPLELAAAAASGGDSAHGFLHASGLPSPRALCEVLTRMLLAARADGDVRGRYSLGFDARSARVRLSVANLGELGELSVRLGGDALTERLGFAPGQTRVLRAVGRPAPLSAGGLGDAGGGLTGGQMGTSDEETWRGGLFGGFEYVDLPCGWYTPTHRPMATGQPLRLPTELDARLNRFTFLPGGSGAGGDAVCLVFRDAHGRTHAAQVPCGVYNPLSIARAVERAMNGAPLLPAGTRFSFAFDARDGCFHVACEGATRDGAPTPANFALLFSHPACSDVTRLGFARTDYAGYASYASEPVHVPRLDWPRVPLSDGAGGTRFPGNLYRASEVGPTKRIAFDANGKPTLVGLIQRYDPALRQLVLAVHVGGAPFAAGAQPGDVLTLFSLAREVDTEGEGAEGADGTNGEAGADGTRAKAQRRTATPFATGERLLLAVAEAATETAVDGSGAGRSPHILTLYVPDLAWGAHVGEAVGVELAHCPFNLCLLESLPQSIGGRRLGFPSEVVQWGVDGTLLAHGGRLRVAPFVAPHVHAMDHPDYVLVYLETGKPGTALIHRAGGRVTAPFAKIILYPLFREERMVPRETILTSGESLSQVVLRFENPDGTPYNFHGADFSFTLNFIY